MRIGLIGCGEWGQNILRELVASGTEVPVVARSEESRRRAGDGGAADVVPSIGSLADVDGVVVATTIGTHAQVIEEALALDVPVFCEKPLTDDPAAANRLLSLAPGRLFVMDMWRYYPGIEMLGEIARSGELGPVVGLSCVRVGWGNPSVDTDGIWALWPHDLAAALEILGRVPPPRSAVCERFRGSPVGMIGILGDDPWCVVNQSIRNPQRIRSVELYCREGRARLVRPDDSCLELYYGADPAAIKTPEMERRAISTETPLRRELEAFRAHLEGGPPPKSSVAEGVEVVTALDTLRALAGLAPAL